MHSSGNRLLDFIAPAKRRAVLRACEPVELALGDVIDEPGEEAEHVYFPTSGAISSLLPLRGGQVVEVALTGNEGLHGASCARGGSVSLVRAEVRIAGGAWRMATADLRHMMASGGLASPVDGYIDAVLAQRARAIACHCYHPIEQRVARKLLMAADRAHSSRLVLTHDVIARALGVRRVGVTNAAGALQKRRLIAYGRGIVTILGRKGLERASCTCYVEDLRAYERALPSTAAASA